ncbi:Uu.00g092910.m01.CDS01 [Anthostomella pinea]|uniref:Uu.00g092910.m01.CDS01 n=1 Tax=Anthostomella pinea TaxID=933095 RepID=A0AAI8VND6_9PEZI|nr:Uu.00g092910.m01.CDS01 [Anthostomella pinea]
MSSTTLSADQINSINIIERVGSVFSLLGCVFIIVTFSCSNAFHKPINRLVFYASFGNMMTNVGTLMATQYTHQVNSFGCQFQAFLIQMFLPADAFWTLAMAVNVYLTFYFKFDATKLRKMEIWYLIICYGVPFVPALTFIFLSKPEAGRMYGDATLWCWVSSGWDIFRIATFYGPVWVVILITFFIYIRAGREIYRKRRQLHKFGGSSSAHDPEAMTGDDLYSVKTTEISVTTESADVAQEEQGIDLRPLGRSASVSGPEPTKNPAYSVTISSNAKGDRRSQIAPVSSSPSNNNDNNADIQPPPTARGRPRTKRRNFEANNAAWSYTKCAILFFTALLVTWIPSSANRVYSVIHVGDTSIPLEYMSALVLPLQGFWNALIYMVTSWTAVKLFFSDIGRRAQKRPASSHYPSDFHDKRNFTFRLSNRNPHKHLESESMTELANSTRPSSNEEPKGDAS